MGKSKSIALGKKDAILVRWKEVISKEEFNDHGKITYLVKSALLHYIQNGTFLCIGKIHALQSTLKRTYLTIWIDDNQTIKDWLSDLQSQGVRPNTFIREILRKSIKIIPEEEKEWIPSFLDLDIVKHSEQTVITDTNVNSSPTIHPHTQLQTQIKPSINNRSPSIAKTPQKSGKSSKKPQCSSLFSEDF